MSKATRRTFVASASASVAALASPRWIKAFGQSGTNPTGTNFFYAFNHIRDAETGESDEFVTIDHIERMLTMRGIQPGTTVIGIGARSGTANDPYGQPGEMGYRWTLGTQWNGVVTSTVDASPVALNRDDPITVTQIGVLDESTAHRFILDGRNAVGSVLWSLYEDDTMRPVIHRGFHNTFSDIDGGMVDALYGITRKAKAGIAPGAMERIRLKNYIPALADDLIWEHFRSTLGQPLIDKQWHAYIREQGWQGAAIVLRGTFANVAQFHLREWNNLTPQDPDFKLGVGIHGPLRIQYGREVRPFMDNETAEWTMVGFLWDEQATGTALPMPEFSKAIDIFGQDFHIHGFRDDGKHGGHTLFSMLGEGPLEVSLYPLSFAAGQAALYNTDLELLAETAQQDGGVFSVSVRNHGETYVRNLGARLAAGLLVEDAYIGLIAPGETARFVFVGPVAQRADRPRIVKLDYERRLLEGGAGRANNEIRV